MPDYPRNKQDFLDATKHQLSQVSAEFDKALDTVKDPQRRRQLTASYIELLQKGLTRAQDSLGKYHDKLAAPPPAGPHDDSLTVKAADTAEPSHGSQGPSALDAPTS
jgi:hypothetical protein